MLGPIVGVAAMVGAVGLTESAKGDLKQKLSQLGTNLIIAQAGGSFGSQNPTFPDDAVHRAKAVSTVTGASATTNLTEVIALPTEGGSDFYQAFPVPVRAADVDLPAVLEVPVIDGRWLSAADIKLHTRPLVLGAGLAKQYALPARRDAHHPAQRHRLRRRRRARAPSRSIPTSTTRCSSRSGPRSTTSRPTASRTSCTSARTGRRRRRPPTRSRPRSTSAAPIRCRRRCRATCCKAASQADKTLQQTALFAGLLALTVGGLGIANVMSISVIQRSSEIGIRRAVGHSRSKIGRSSCRSRSFVGVLGGILGAARDRHRVSRRRPSPTGSS